MTTTITVPYEEYKKLEQLQLEIDKLKSELKQEKDKKNGTLYLKIKYFPSSLSERFPIGTIHFAIDDAPMISLERRDILELELLSVIKEASRQNINILTEEHLHKLIENMEKRQFNLLKKEKELDDKLNNLPKWLKWFL
jgi:hypothetical protein